MRTPGRHPVVVAVATASLILAAVAGPAQAGATSWLSASPTSSPIALAAGGSVTITNTDRRASSSALAVTLASNPD